MDHVLDISVRTFLFTKTLQLKDEKWMMGMKDLEVFNSIRSLAVENRKILVFPQVGMLMVVQLRKKKTCSEQKPRKRRAVKFCRKTNLK